ncbi:hypothetical protein JCM10212_005461 [Sporobolomyces blumeae]
MAQSSPVQDSGHDRGPWQRALAVLEPLARAPPPSDLVGPEGNVDDPLDQSIQDLVEWLNRFEAFTARAPSDPVVDEFRQFLSTRAFKWTVASRRSFNPTAWTPAAPGGAPTSHGPRSPHSDPDGAPRSSSSPSARSGKRPYQLDSGPRDSTHPVPEPIVARLDPAEATTTTTTSRSNNAESTSSAVDRERTRKVVAVVEAVRGLLHGLHERAEEGNGEGGRDGTWWYEVGLGICEGLQGHLELNSLGNKDRPDLAYRVYLCSILGLPLLRLVIPSPGKVLTSSADDASGMMRPGLIESGMKYAALDVLAQLLSKNEENKAIMRGLGDPGDLGKILHAGFDHHLSLLVFELVARLLPNPKSSPLRAEFVRRVISDDTFSVDKGSELRKRLDGISMKSHEEWDRGCNRFLGEISKLHIRRSQYFDAVSIEYNRQQLLLRLDSEDAQAAPEGEVAPPSLEELADGTAYESALVWVSRHVVAFSVAAVQNDIDATDIQRAVVPLEGVEKVFVEDLGEQLDLLRLTLLLSRSSPLTLSTRPHLSRPSHQGLSLVPIDASEVSEQRYDGTPVEAYHELVVVVRAEGDVLSVWKNTMKERGSRYPRLLEEIPNYPTRPTRPVTKPKKPVTTDSTRSEPPRNKTKHDDQAAGSEAPGTSKHVQFKPSPDLATSVTAASMLTSSMLTSSTSGGFRAGGDGQPRAGSSASSKRKTSEAEEPIAGVYPETDKRRKGDEQGRGDPDAAGDGAPEQRERETEQGDKVGAVAAGEGEEAARRAGEEALEPIAEEADQEDERVRQSQEAANKRRLEVLSLAGLGSDSTEGPPPVKRARRDEGPAASKGTESRGETECQEVQEKKGRPQQDEHDSIEPADSESYERARSLAAAAKKDKAVERPSVMQQLLEEAKRRQTKATAPHGEDDRPEAISEAAQVETTRETTTPASARSRANTTGVPPSATTVADAKQREVKSGGARTKSRETGGESSDLSDVESDAGGSKARPTVEAGQGAGTDEDDEVVVQKAKSKRSKSRDDAKATGSTKEIDRESDLPPAPKKPTSKYSRKSLTKADGKAKKQERSRSDEEDELEESEDRGTAKKITKPVRKSPKKVVAPAKAARKSAPSVASKGKGKKRPRVQTSSEESEVEAEETSESEEGESSDDADLVDVKQLKAGKKATTSKKKVVKPSKSKAATSKPASKRVKAAANGSDTDYDNEPGRSLEAKKEVNAYNKYGKDKAAAAKRANGKTKKAGRKSVASKSSDADGESADGQASRPTRASTGKGQVKTDRKGRKKRSLEDDEAQSSDSEDVEAKEVTKPKRAGQGRQTKTTVEPLASPRAGPLNDKRIADDIPPPADLKSVPLAFTKPRPPTSGTGTATSSKAKKSFAELTKEESGQAAGLPDLEADVVLPPEGGEDDLGGFEHHWVDYSEDDLPQVAAAVPDQQSSPARPLGDVSKPVQSPARSLTVADPAVGKDQSRRATQSLSPIADPARADLSYVDTVFGESAATVRPALTATAELSKPAVLVQDTPKPSKEHQVERQGTFLGDHRISTQRGEDSFDIDEERRSGAGGAVAGVERQEEGQEDDDESDDMYVDHLGPADDSGVHFVDLESGAKHEGHDGSTHNEEQYDNQSQPELSSEPVAQAAPAERPLLSPRTRLAEALRRPSTAARRGLPAPPTLARKAQVAEPVAPSPRFTPPRPLPLPSRSQEERRAQRGPATAAIEEPLAAGGPSHGILRLAPVASTSRASQPLPDVPPKHARVSLAPRLPPRRPSESRARPAHREKKKISSPSPSVSAERYDSFAAVETASETIDDDFDEFDRSVYEGFLDLALIMARKNRQKRLERQELILESVERIEEPLRKYLSTVLVDTSDIVNSAQAYFSSADDASGPSKSLEPQGNDRPTQSSSEQTLLATVASTTSTDERIWRNVQRELDTKHAAGSTTAFQTSHATQAGQEALQEEQEEAQKEEQRLAPARREGEELRRPASSSTDAPRDNATT